MLQIIFFKFAVSPFCLWYFLFSWEVLMCTWLSVLIFSFMVPGDKNMYPVHLLTQPSHTVSWLVCAAAFGARRGGGFYHSFHCRDEFKWSSEGWQDSPRLHGSQPLAGLTSPAAQPGSRRLALIPRRCLSSRTLSLTKTTSICSSFKRPFKNVFGIIKLIHGSWRQNPQHTEECDRRLRVGHMLCP